MHMADALVSPAVGGAMWAATAGLIAYSARDVKDSLDEPRIPLMGVLGAFVFAAQMINVSIPGTGSSGHLGGGVLLGILLGPPAAFLVMASVLSVQALFFADGGLLALGCNIFNIGFVPAFLACPLVYRPVAGRAGVADGRRRSLAAVVASIVALQLGAFAVVLETTLSGVSDLPFSAFVAILQPIHLAIGLLEGLATAAVVGFVARARPEVMAGGPGAAGGGQLRPVLVGLLAVAVLVGGGLSWFASTHPDGLEWSIRRLTGRDEIDVPESGAHGWASRVQERTALLPDYGFPATGREGAPDLESLGPPRGEPADAAEGKTAVAAVGEAEVEPAPWPAIDAGTSVSGIVGGAIVLVLIVLIGCALRIRPASLARKADGATP